MPRNNIRIVNLNRISSTDLDDDDIIPIGRKTGSAAVGIKVSELEKKFESDGLDQIIKDISSNYQILVTDDILYVTGNITLTFASVSLMGKQIVIRNISGNTVLAPSGSDTSEKTSLTTGQSTTLGPRKSTSALLQI